ncbi:hypothetical protein BCR34DRAFT_660460 [Clohesyomyces aquaticus]|uniref:Peptidase metallopeptidase domain-containing protein n=1 Tax=Clohesyomyces aquaticus TaxID=1231657 RepID=A0A1Y2A6Q7_9PLEO|nr:hypothetical protein BCR34DRAFT_660460 [Clohesyomyces aquaticus]
MKLRNIITIIILVLLTPRATPSCDVFNGYNQPWPRGSDGLVTIEYCFDNDQIEEKRESVIKTGLETWMEALGGRASPETGHALKFQHQTDYYCSINGQWNPRVPKNTLQLKWLQGPLLGENGGRASVGFIPQSGPNGGNNYIEVSPNAIVELLVHEIGHVLGMGHEHQRADRDKYVKYQCDKVEGYQKAVTCAAGLVALDCEFMGHAYVVNNRPYPPFNIRSDDYDLTNDDQSVMHYGSPEFAAGPCNPEAPDGCPLLKYKNPNRHEGGYETFLQVDTPSDLDVEWVKQTYPYMPPPPGVRNP